MTELETERLTLRLWNEEDKIPFFALNSCPEVMQFFPKLLTKEESDNMVSAIMERFNRQKYFGLWAVELKDNNQFIGFVGLNIPTVPFHFSPCIEIGWRLAKQAWNKGYATEAAQCVTAYAFANIKLNEIVAFTAQLNLRSAHIMEKLGMIKTEEFEHPSIDKTNPLCPHFLYRLTREEWLARL